MAKTKLEEQTTLQQTSLCQPLAALVSESEPGADIPPHIWEHVQARAKFMATMFAGFVFAIEIYAGCMRLSGALVEQGLRLGSSLGLTPKTLG